LQLDVDEMIEGIQMLFKEASNFEEGGHQLVLFLLRARRTSRLLIGVYNFSLLYRSPKPSSLSLLFINDYLIKNRF
jgi:hypothetical protein